MLNNRKKIIFAFVVVFLLSTFYFLLSTSIEAAAPLQLRYTFPCAPIGGGACPTEAEVAQSPAAYIARLYQFALMLSGMLAFGMIVFGAIQYTVSAGNTTQQSDARDRITQALWGVALLFGAYLILHTIDPKLVSLKDPNITTLAVQAQPQTIEERKQIAEKVLPKLTIDELKTRREKAEEGRKEFKEKMDKIKNRRRIPESDKNLFPKFFNSYLAFEQEIQMIDQEIAKREIK